MPPPKYTKAKEIELLKERMARLELAVSHLERRGKMEPKTIVLPPMRDLEKRVADLEARVTFGERPIG